MNKSRNKVEPKIIALLEITLFFTILTFTPIISVDIFAKNFEYDPQIQLSYTVHEPIVISNNGNFSDYGFSGTGLIDEPYVIKDYNITNHNSGESGILVSGTTAFFVITDCYILARTNGIEIENVASGTATILNNTCSAYDGVSITLRESDNVTLVDNLFENSDYYGLYIISSLKPNITQNTFNNIPCGAYLSFSHNATLYDNTCNNADYGFHLYRSQYSNISSNTFTNSGIFLYENSIADYLTHKIENNYVNGKLLGFFTEVFNSIPLIVYGQLILIDCGFLDIEGLTLSNTAIGLQLIHCTNIIVEKNTFNNNYNGIYLSFTTSSIIQENTVSYNTKNGIYLIYSDNNIFEYNELRENIEYGIYIDAASDSNRVSRNNFYDNNLAEILTCFLSQAYDYQLNNYWYDAYTTTGNYWSEGHNGFYVIDGPDVGENRYDEYPLDGPAVPPVVNEYTHRLSFMLLLIPSLATIQIIRKKKKYKL